MTQFPRSTCAVQHPAQIQNAARILPNCEPMPMFERRIWSQTEDKAQQDTRKIRIRDKVFQKYSETVHTQDYVPLKKQLLR